MTDDEWQLRSTDAAYKFGLECAILADANPFSLEAPLNGFIQSLMTELWDRNFSQTDIRNAFHYALRAMPQYAVEERRSPTSAKLATADWQAPK